MEKKGIGNFIEIPVIISFYLILFSVGKVLIFDSLYFKSLFALFILIAFFLTRKVVLDIFFYIWLPSIVINFISCYYSQFPSFSFLYSINYLIGFLFYVYFAGSRENVLYREVTFFHKLFSSIYLFFTILPLINLDIYRLVINKLFEPSMSEIILNLLYFQRYAGIAGYTGMNGFFLTTGLVIIFSEILFQTEQIIFLNSIVMALYIFAILLTGSRYSLISMFISLLFIFLFRMFKENRKKRYILGIYFFTVLSLVFLSYQIAKLVIPDFTTIFLNKLFYYQSIKSRFYLYDYALGLFSENVFLGNGINTFLPSTFSAPAGLERTFVHNVFIQLLAELGILGTILFLLPYLYIYFATIKNLINFSSERQFMKKSCSAVTLAITAGVQTVFLLYFFTGNPIYDNNILYTYFLFAGIFVGMYRKDSRITVL